MKTMIKGSWVIAWSGEEHQVIRDGVCVVEDDRIRYVGSEYEGRVDRTVDLSGHLVSPGLISTHLHTHNNAAQHVFLDVGRPDAAARNYLNWQAIPLGKTRYRADRRSSILFGLSQCLRSGVTTVVEIGCSGEPSTFVESVDELGIRAYAGPSYRNVKMYSTPEGQLKYDWDDERGSLGLQAALAFAERFDGAAKGRVKPILCPGHADTCSEAVLRETAEIAHERDMPVTIHTAHNPHAMSRTLDRHRLTPIQYLAKLGLLGTRIILGHVVFPAGHSWVPYTDAPDIELMGEHRATVSHSPLGFLQMGAHLESLKRYIDAGINMTIGTDIPPADIVAEMRYAMLMSRVADRHFMSGRPRDVFDAVTVNPAKALGRNDLGKLTPGAKADLVTFDMRKLHIGAIYDPVKSLIEMGSGSDASLVMVDGKVVIERGRLATVDEEELLATVQTEGDKIFADIPNWIWGGRSVEEVVPPSYEMVGRAD